jgi:hypothetical protein
MADESVYASLLESTLRVLLRFVFVFEPLAPTAIVVAVNQQLRRYKASGAIGNYKTKAKRLGKYHYRVEVDLDATGMQAIHLLGNLFPRQLNRFRRWFHD